MPRGKAKSDEDKLQELDNQIAEMESRKASIDNKIKDFKAQKKAIIDAQNTKKLEELQEFISSTGKSPDEIMAILKEKI